jgi:hypothetical protein
VKVIAALSKRYRLSFASIHLETFFATPRIVARMMSGEECRAKARQSLELAKQMPGAQLQAEWRTMARDWPRLGLMADEQDRMPCD